MSDTARDQAQRQVDSICALVAALECDFDRLDELRKEREALEDSVRDASLDVDCAAQSLKEVEGADGEEYMRQRLAELADARQTLLETQAALAEWVGLCGEELAELEEAAGEWSCRDDVEGAIHEDPLSIKVRTDWHDPGSSKNQEPSEFRIVLCTGGPHVEILGELDHHGEPDRVRVLYRDWGYSGELFDFDHEAVLTYCQQFSFA
jgi:hypothetical protein